MSVEQEQVEVARWYTPALRIPKLVGKLPSGERIWGGPYRPVQLGLGVITAGVGIKTMGLWGNFHPLFNYVVLLAAAAGVTWVARYLPNGSTNPLDVVRGGARVALSSTHGNWGTYSVRAVDPVQVRSRVAVHLLADAPVVEMSAAEPDPAPGVGGAAIATQAHPPTASKALPVTPGVEDKLAALLTR